MKQTFTLLALLFLGLAANGQYYNLKSTQGLKQALDSMDLIYYDSGNDQWDSTKYYIEYDASGQMTLLYTTYTDNSTGEVLGGDRYVYSYNTDGSMIEYLNLEWDEDIDDWELDFREVYSYDEDGNQIGYISYDWDNSGNVWTRNDSIVNTYNEQGFLIEYSGYEWKADQWIIRHYSEYSYNAQGLLLDQITRMWYEDDQEWKNNIKFEYSYNGEGQMLTTVRSDQDVYDGPWLLEYKLENAYNDEYSRITTSSAHWKTDQWEIYYADTVDYNSSGLATEDRGYYLDEGNMRPNYIYVYSYDANGNLIEYIDHSWDRNASSMELSAKYNYSYDLDYTMAELLLPIDNDLESDLILEYVSNMPLGSHAYYWRNESWEDYRRINYFYSEMNVEGVGVEENELVMARLYPNPVSDLLQVELEEGSLKATLTLYELTGRQVLRRQINSGGAVSLSTLPAGVYLYKLTVDGKIQSGKLMKR